MAVNLSSDSGPTNNIGKITRKDLLCTIPEKNGYREFDHSGTLM